MGHRQDDQGFHLTSIYWVGHAHNIYLQYATDFGIIMILCFIGFNVASIVRLLKRYVESKLVETAVALFLILIPLLFGMLEYSWGSGSIKIILLFFGWQSVIQNNKQEKRITSK